jgi:hypothetical protein
MKDRDLANLFALDADLRNACDEAEHRGWKHTGFWAAATIYDIQRIQYRRGIRTQKPIRDAVLWRQE